MLYSTGRSRLTFLALGATLFAGAPPALAGEAGAASDSGSAATTEPCPGRRRPLVPPGQRRRPSPCLEQPSPPAEAQPLPEPSPPPLTQAFPEQPPAAAERPRDEPAPRPRVVSPPPLPPQPPAPKEVSHDDLRDDLGESDGARDISRRFGPLASVTLLTPNGFWDSSALSPGFGGQVGLRFGLLQRPRGGPSFNIAVGAFIGFETWGRAWAAAAIAPGVRLEINGTRDLPLLLPYLSFYTFLQLVAPLDGTGVAPRFGLGLNWNVLAAIERWGGGGFGGGFGGLGGGGGEAALLLIPIVAAVTFVLLGDIRVYLQPDPRTGRVMGGFSVGYAI